LASPTPRIEPIADQRVQTGGRDAEVPGAEVPGDSRGEQGEHHHQATPGVDVDQQFHRQQVDDGVGHPDAAEQHAEKVEDAGEDHCQVRRHRIGVDHCCHRVGGVVEAVDELETEDEEQGEDEAGCDPEVQAAEEIEHESVRGGSLEARDYARRFTSWPLDM